MKKESGPLNVYESDELSRQLANAWLCGLEGLVELTTCANLELRYKASKALAELFRDTLDREDV